MKKTLSYLAFALVASTASLATALPAPTPCDETACAPDEVCELISTDCACDTPAPGDEDPAPCICETEYDAVCVPAPPEACESDTDCEGEDVCVTYSYGSCSGGGAVSPACDPDDQECEPTPIPEPEPCVEETESICVPKYAAPCQAAADCGAGFTCETPEICTCTTGGPVVCDTEEGTNCEDAPRMDDECSCAPSEGDAYCRLIEVECTSDTDCANGSKCESQGDLRAAIACEPDTNCDEPLPEPKSYCIPEGYEDWSNNGGTNTVGGRKVESAKRTGFFNPPVGNGTGSKDSATCSVSQGPEGFAGSALLLFAMMIGFRRKKK